MKKVALNKCFGGFELSKEAKFLYLKKKYPNSKITTKKDNYYSSFIVDGKEVYLHFSHDEREDKALVETIEELGDAANTSVSKLRVVEIPDDVNYEITDYDGIECAEEIHRVW